MLLEAETPAKATCLSPRRSEHCSAATVGRAISSRASLNAAMASVGRAMSTSTSPAVVLLALCALFRGGGGSKCSSAAKSALICCIWGSFACSHIIKLAVFFFSLAFISETHSIRNQPYVVDEGAGSIRVCVECWNQVYHSASTRHLLSFRLLTARLPLPVTY